MSASCVIGLQWGDEAKGKIVDLLTAKFDVVVRFLGGANAGHTVVLGDETYKLHHIPSGILRPEVTNVVTGGVVINPPVMIQEMDSLIERGVKVTDNLLLSDRAHVIFPWHLAEDAAVETATAADRESIGTTLRGIGPCYKDKVGRTNAFRLADLYRDNFKDRVTQVCNFKKNAFQSVYGAGGDLNPQAIYEDYAVYAERLKPHVCDTNVYLLDTVEGDKRLLFEGAQGSLLDVDHGTYPYVTSSNSSGVGVSAGSGVPGRWISKVIGIAKSYTTRVGGGPFPTELENETGEHIRIKGNEFGTTTGRPRRCGWFDAVAVRYTARLSGVSCLSMMMVDVLSELEEIQVCVAYDLNGERIEHFPSHVDDLRQVKPIYETLPGWQTDVTGAREWDDLPPKAQGYLKRISELVGAPIAMVSVGPDREQTITVDESLI